MADPVPPVVNAQPSRDPANDGTLTGMLKQIMQKNMQSMDDCMPASVIAFDRVANRATVQPMIKVVGTNGQTLTRAQIVSVPVYQIGAGGFMLNFNLKAGDLGWIKATDRDMGLYLQGCTEQQPNSQRMHSFNDGFFLPQIMQGFTIDPEDAENAVWQTLDGSVRVALWSDRVKITAPRTVVESPIVEVISTTSVAITSPETTIDGKLTVTGDVQMDSKLHVDDTIVSDQTVTGTVDVIAGTKLLKAHTHGSGAPNPILGTTSVNN